MLPSQTLAAIAAQVSRTLTGACKVERPIHEKDAYGAPVSATSLITASLPCRVIRGKSHRQVDDKQRVMLETYTLVTAAGADIQADDLITVGADKYQITGIVNRRTDAVDLQATMIRAKVS
jgi:hypothetical protein